MCVTRMSRFSQEAGSLLYLGSPRTEVCTMNLGPMQNETERLGEPRVDDEEVVPLRMFVIG